MALFFCGLASEEKGTTASKLMYTLHNVAEI